MADLVLNWGLLGAYGTDLTDDETTTVDTGGVQVGITYSGEHQGASAFTFNADGYVGEDEPFAHNSFLKLFGDQGDPGLNPTSTTVLNFAATNEEYGDEVQNVSFRLNDIDGGQGGDLHEAGDGSWQDSLTITAYDAEGNPVDVQLSGPTASGDTATGDGPTEFTDASGSVLVNIAGPVSRIEFSYDNGGTMQQGALISDIHFQTTDYDDGNEPPDAVDDSATTEMGTPVIIDVLGNDTDPDGDPLTVTSVSDDENGTTTLNEDGTVTFTPNEGYTGETDFTYTISDGNGGTDTANVHVEVPCFTPGTKIATPLGERLVEELREGDRIITRDNGIQEIRWLGRKVLTGHDLARKPHLKPILIQAGSLGNGLPEHDMLVSPNHRVLVNNDKTALYFEEREVLAAAKHLTGLRGVDEVTSLGVEYIHFMFDQHEVVLSNGAWTESFQPGEMTLGGIGNAQRTEILELFPELQTAEGLEGYAAARRSLKKHEAQLLVK